MEYGGILHLIILAGTLILREIQGQSVPDSPCADIFQYERDSFGIWSGIINVPNPLPYLAIDLRVSMYITDHVPSDTHTKLELVDSNAWRKLAAGDRDPVRYRLRFPLQSPLPLINSITVNQDVICKGTRPRAPLITTMTIQHAIFNQKCGSSSLRCPDNRLSSEESFIPIFEPPPKHETALPVNQDSSSFSGTSCPEIFKYERDGAGNWYGLILVPNPYPVVAINLKVEVYLEARIPSGRTGDLELVNDLKQEWRRMKTGEQYSVPYRLSFPLQSPLPKVKTIIANNKVLCRGDKPDSSRITTLSFQHDIYNEKCSSSSLDCPFNTEAGTIPFNFVPTPEPTPRPTPPPVRRTRPPPTRRPEPVPQPEEPAPIPDIPTVPIGSDSSCGHPVIRPNPLIFFGKDTSRGQWPWHAALFLMENFDTKYICGGSFIGKKTILTAAHCVTRKNTVIPQKASSLHVYLGRYDLRLRREDDSQDLDVSQVFVHPEFNRTNYEADLAILILKTTVTITQFVRPVCLWSQPANQPVRKDGIVVGWGLDENGETAKKLKMVKMPIVDRLTCIDSNSVFFSQFASEKKFCAGYKNGSSVCNGDSGGGMVLPMEETDGSVTWMLRGVVSISKRKLNTDMCDNLSYIIFTDVAHYLEWISMIII